MSDYNDSLDKIAQAEATAAIDNWPAARRLWREAAVLQERMVAGLPPERHYTRTTYGLSVATLYYRAGELDDAQRIAEELAVRGYGIRDTEDKVHELLTKIAEARGETPDATR